MSNWVYKLYSTSRRAVRKFNLCLKISINNLQIKDRNKKYIKAKKKKYKNTTNQNNELFTFLNGMPKDG